MKRRHFLVLAGAASVAVGTSRRSVAQSAPAMKRLGVLISFAKDDPDLVPLLSAIQEGLANEGWVDGKTVRIDYQFGADIAERAEPAAQLLISLRPDAILNYATPGALALAKFTKSIPIVFTGVSDPVGRGLIDSVARPSGNITGFSLLEPSLGGKYFDLLRELAPETRTAAIMFGPQTAGPAAVDIQVPAFLEAAARAGVVGRPLRVEPNEAAIAAAIAPLAAQAGCGLVVTNTPNLVTIRKLLIAAVNGTRIPTVYYATIYAADGGLLSYYPDSAELARGAATYVGKVLHGVQIAELPVQAPTRFQLVVNLKTARAQGIFVPTGILARADQVIE